MEGGVTRVRGDASLRTRRQRMRPGDVYGIYPRLDASFVFYSGHFAESLESPAELRGFLERPGRVWVLAQRDDWGRLDPQPPLVEVARDSDPSEGYLLLARPEMVGAAPR